MFRASLCILSTLAASLEMVDEEGESLARLFDESRELVSPRVQETSVSNRVHQGPIDVFYDNLWPVKPKNVFSSFPLYNINHDYQTFTELLRSSRESVAINMMLMHRGGVFVEVSFELSLHEDYPFIESYLRASYVRLDAVNCIGGRRVEKEIFLLERPPKTDLVNEHFFYQIVKTIAINASQSYDLKAYVHNLCERKLPVDEFSPHLTTNRKLFASFVILQTHERSIHEYFPFKRASYLNADLACLVSEKSSSGQQLFAIIKSQNVYIIVPIDDIHPDRTVTEEQYHQSRFFRSFVDVGRDWCQQLSEYTHYSFKRLYDIGLPIDRLV